MADENLITECSGVSTSNSAITSCTTSLTDAEDVDENGIPVSVKHSTQNFFATVWAFIHLLAVPIPDSTSPGRPYTHICIVCANERKSADPTSTARKSCLMRQKTSSNARKHMLKMHKSHAYSKETKQAGQDDRTCRIKAFDAFDKPNIKKQRTIQETFVINRDEIRILATKWLLSSGLPFSTLENEELQNFLRRLSNNPSLVIPARDTFYAFADGEYQNLFQLVSLSLRKEFDAVLQQPFLSVLHDLATNAANVNIIGTIVVYIDSEWRLRTVSLLALANSSGHAAPQVANHIKTTIQSRYNINLDQFSRFTVSDTTGSARNVGDHFNYTDQVDCLMHLLSLCILYAVGLKENTRNDGQDIVTPGGEFKDGSRVIQKLRDVATFFNTPQRLQKLKEIKKLYNLPPADIKVDAKTRVGYAISLMRRSEYNYYALTKYFDSAPENEQSVWKCITPDDWTLITEMEGLTDQLAQFSFGEVQKVGVDSSYVLLFRKMLSLAVESEIVECLQLERPERKGTEYSQRRFGKNVNHFSAGGIRCRDRLRMQLQLRFPNEDVNDVKALLLDPRIKSKAASIVNDAAILAQAQQELQLEHEVIYQKMFAQNLDDEEYKESGCEPAQQTPTFFCVPFSAVNSLLEIDGPSMDNETRPFRKDLGMGARNSWNYWTGLNVSWQNVSTDGGKYNALRLYREIDILAWFREPISCGCNLSQNLSRKATFNCHSGEIF